MRGSRVGLVTVMALAAQMAAAPAALTAAEVAEPGKIQFFGYGEVHYNNPRVGTMDPGAGNLLDYHRFVLGWEYGFTEKIRVAAEVDYEHAAQELELEYAFLEFDLLPALAVRAGSLLMPFGPLNEFHEPPVFYSVERPYVERYLVPTTWQEIGAGIAGQAHEGRLSYRAYLTAGLDATQITGFNGLRNASSKGSESAADDLAGVGRLEWGVAKGLTLAGSAYHGEADQRTPGLGDVTVTILGGDLRFREAGFDIRGVYDRASIDGADRLSTFLGETIGETMQGWYAEVAYDLLRHLGGSEDGRALRVFGRREEFDTHEEVPAGFLADPAVDREVTTGGVAYYPIEKIAIKADLEHWKDGTGAKLNRVNLGAAFMF